MGGVLWGARPTDEMVGLPVRFQCQELGQLPGASDGSGFRSLLTPLIYQIIAPVTTRFCVRTAIKPQNTV